jgi:hypothetical protein
MSATVIADLTNQINKYWAPTWKSELLETDLLSNLCSKEYEGQIKRGGDTVHVTQVTRPSGNRKAKGSGHEFFETEKLGTSRISITADQVYSAAYEIDELIDLQTDLEKNESVIKQNLLDAMKIKLNTYLYSFVNATTPISGVTDFNGAQLQALRKFAGANKWNRQKQWYILADASYYSDLLGVTALTSADFVNDKPIVGDMAGMKRFNFNIFEDNSDGLLDVIATETGTDTEDVAVAFHPDFLHSVIQEAPTFEIAPLISNKQFGYILVAKMVGGAALGHDSASLHQTVFNT